MKSGKELALDNAIEIKRMMAELISKMCRDKDLVDATNEICYAINSISKAINKLEE